MTYQQLYWARVVWCRGIRAVMGFNDGKVLAFVRTLLGLAMKGSWVYYNGIPMGYGKAHFQLQLMIQGADEYHND